MAKKRAIVEGNTGFMSNIIISQVLDSIPLKHTAFRGFSMIQKKRLREILDSKIDWDYPINRKKAILVGSLILIGTLVGGKMLIDKRLQSSASYYDYRIKQLTQNIENKGSDPDVTLELAMTYYLKGEVEKGLELMEELYSKDPENKAVMLDFGQMLSDQNQYGESTEILEKLHKGFPGYEMARVNLTLGRNYYEVGEYQKAIKNFEEGLKRESGTTSAYYYLGLSYKQAGEMAQAKEALEKAISMAGSYPEAQEALVDLQK